MKEQRRTPFCPAPPEVPGLIRSPNAAITDRMNMRLRMCSEQMGVMVQRFILAALAVAAQGSDVPSNAPMKIDGDTAGGVLQQSSTQSLVVASVAREASSVEKATKRASATVAVNKPNVLLVLVDGQGHGDIDLGVGKAEFHTPTLAALASEGVRLSNFYSGATCTPSRAMLMTGRYAMRFGFQD